MKSKHLKKIIILSFVFCMLFMVLKASPTNTDSMSYINYGVNEEYNEDPNNIIQTRNVQNPNGNHKPQQATTWFGFAILGVIFIVALKTIPSEKRL